MLKISSYDLALILKNFKKSLEFFLGSISIWKISNVFWLVLKLIGHILNVMQ